LSELSQLALFAEYNQLMNQRLFSAARELSDENVKKDCSAFFNSVFGTLNHIMVGDIVWLKRFAEHPSSQVSLSYIAHLEKPQSLSSNLFADLDSLSIERERIDEIIIQWLKGLSEKDLNDCISYNNMAGDPFKKQYSSLINHLFLHQIHHRGQVTVLMSQFGIDFGETDIIEIINECSA
jgi:uncharacterized damage-inducible protein DinB